jgi:cytochrome c oxidase assembly protein Cox11
LKSIKPISGELEVDFRRNDFLVANNEPFQVDFMVRNKSQRTIVARLNHLIEPRRLANRLEMIACGSLLPMQLRPGETREISSSYIFGGELAPKARISITYEFVLDSRAAKTKTTFQLRKAKLG